MSLTKSVLMIGFDDRYLLVSGVDVMLEADLYSGESMQVELKHLTVLYSLSLSRLGCKTSLGVKE